MLSILETESHSIHILSSRSGLTLHTALYLKTQCFWILFLKQTFALRVSDTVGCGFSCYAKEFPNL